MIKAARQFFITLLLFFSGAFVMHLIILNYINIKNVYPILGLNYLVNFVLAYIILLTLNALKNRFFDYLGFIFIASSFIKFIIFFLFIYPIFKSDKVVTNFETTAFLIPYFVGLTLEVYFVSKMLNQDK